jgi:hypothetical protein
VDEELMTTLYTVSIHCDNCGEWVEAAPSKQPKGVSLLAKQLKKEGWSRVTNSMYQDLCPTCLKKSHKGELKGG